MAAILRDSVRQPVRVLFVGINPGIRSAAIGHHFAGSTFMSIPQFK
jgi:G:T/U-mismatch repair DNA glycosylase